MINKNYIELDNIIVVGWVNNTLDQALSRKNIISRLKNIGIWPLDLKTMDEITMHSSLYIVVNQTKEKQDDDYQSNQEEDGEMEWVEQNVAKEFNCRTYNS
jgi:hypothetical protein